MRQWQKFAITTVLALSGASWAVAAENPKPARPDATAQVGEAKVAVNPQTGRLLPLSAEEVQKVARSLRQMLQRRATIRPTESGGPIAADLNGGFMNVWLARLDSQGKVQNACVDTMDGALAFLNSTGDAEVR